MTQRALGATQSWIQSWRGTPFLGVPVLCPRMVSGLGDAAFCGKQRYLESCKNTLSQLQSAGG